MNQPLPGIDCTQLFSMLAWQGAPVNRRSYCETIYI